MSSMPTRRQTTRRGSTTVALPDSPYEAAYVAFRHAIDAHLGKAAWVDSDSIEIERYTGTPGRSGRARGNAAYQTITPDGRRASKRREVRWEVEWGTTWTGPNNSGVPTTVLTSFTITPVTN